MRYCSVLHPLPRLLFLHSTVLCTGHVYSSGTASNYIPAATAWHQQDKASPSVAHTPSPFTHLHKGFTALSLALCREKNGARKAFPSPAPCSGQETIGTRLLHSTRFREICIKRGMLFIHLTCSEPASCSTSSPYVFPS